LAVVFLFSEVGLGEKCRSNTSISGLHLQPVLTQSGKTQEMRSVTRRLAAEYPAPRVCGGSLQNAAGAKHDRREYPAFRANPRGSLRSTTEERMRRSVSLPMEYRPPSPFGHSFKQKASV